MLPRRFLVPFLSVCLLAVSSLSVAQSPSSQALQGIPEYAPDHVLVKFTTGASASAIGEAHRQAGGNPIKTISGIGVQVVQVAAGTVPAAIAAYEKNPNVAYAEPDYYRLLAIPQEENATPLGGTNLFDDQWYLNNTGQLHVVKIQSCHPLFGCTVELGDDQGTADADIDAPEAWDISTGSPDVKIAVLDSGVDCNTLELSPKCGDRNDYINYATEPGIYFDSCAAGNPACDNLGHGTGVASEAAAATNNNEGIAGVGWNTQIGVFKVCYQALVTDGINLFTVGLCPVSHSMDAIVDAVTSGHHVITMSYGSDLILPNGDIVATDPSTAECDQIEYAVNEGVTVIAAAGNNGNTTKVYPAACTHSISGESTVIAVAASDHNDGKASFSTYSMNADDWVSIAAPGEGIILVMPNAFCLLPDPPHPDEDTCVDWWDGTSMAAPLVAGAASLVWAHLYSTGATGAGQPPSDCTFGGLACNQVVRERLENNADSTGANGQNWLNWTQHGRLNVAAALSDGGVPDTCGNNSVGGSEVCDGTDLAGQDCTTLGLGFTGGTLACDADCNGFDTSLCVAGASCGNNTVEGTEVCDGTDLAGQDCTTLGLGFTDGTLACDASSSCTAFDTSGCTTCGDGAVEGTEDCDGANLGGATCQTLGFESGTLACDAACTFDTSGCTGGCGDGICDGIAAGEDCVSCPEDCAGVQTGKPSQRWCCGDSVCDAGLEDDVSCEIDCGVPPGASCGDGAVEGTEDCDGANLGGATCQTLGFESGTLACDAACSFDTSSCTGGACSAVGDSCTEDADCCSLKCRGKSGSKTCK